MPPDNVPVLDLSRQYAALGAEIQAAVADVCSAGRFVLGREVTEFEHAVEQQYAIPSAIGCASGTDALWLAMAALGIGPGDAVITTPFSFFATASSILRVGATPVFADIDPVSMNLSAASAAEVLQAHQANPVKALLPVHLYGQCADWDSLQPLAAAHGLTLVEDAAQAFGASWRGIYAGALGDTAAFSFYPTKNLSAWGDAGMTTARDATVAERAKALRAHGMRRRYFHDEVGWNSRLDTVQAAVLLVKLKHIARWNQERARATARYTELLTAAGVTGSVRDGALLLPTADPRGTHVWHQYVVRTLRRNDLRAHLAAQGIGSEVYYPLCLHQQEALKHLGYRTGQFPESEKAAATVLALPIYPELRDDEQDRVVEAIRSFFM
ncbi:DegT/DnrJ/EryC1/StrS family aminotransferase [Terriglobus sp.]|uniref:DegT/DnrJ/EryC1/StrS family aminotransferase n=1 Tax=Terriglobus sp. TaxID=1889013 RepID=UPI003AFFDB7A